MSSEVTESQHFFVDLHFLVKLEAVRHIDFNNAVKNGFISVFRLESIPLCLVTVCQNHAVKMQHVAFAW